MRQANLVLHCGAHNVIREQVAATLTPARTETWVPISHGTLLDQVQTCLTGHGLHVVSEAHGLARDGDRYFGLLHVANATNPEDFGLVVGVRNSHDKSFPASLVLGASVFVCDNLSFSGEVKLSRKHTSRIEADLPQLVNRAIGLLGGLRRTQEERFGAYRKTELADAEAHDLMVRAMDGQVLPVTRLPDVLAEWRQPRHPEFRQGWTAWRLFNAFTEILKGQLDRLPRRTQALHGLMDAACGLAVPTSHKSEDAEIQIGLAA
jgi:hypothetical protein